MTPSIPNAPAPIDRMEPGRGGMRPSYMGINSNISILNFPDLSVRNGCSSANFFAPLMSAASTMEYPLSCETGVYL